MNSQDKIASKDSKNFIGVFGTQMPSKQMFKSFSAWSLLISNLLIALFTIIEKQSVLNMLWVYWFQSVIIGVFNFFRILSLKEFAVDGLKMNNKPLKQTKAAKVTVATFFLFHYGFFHFVYAMFLFSFFSMGGILIGGIDSIFILLTALIFFVNYLGEFIFTFKREQTTVPSLPRLMMAPYKRIIPMHLTIILAGFVLIGGAFGATNPNIVILLIFIGLKTLIDLITHSY
ncbi:MAG: hypothetical protein A2315_09445 [Ignavibacteria bacterium RIFOXYB2_FULL_35_12]|nr:MAG: hypothetical protein A2058_10780 [Ignavibacteria bacterium GWA2_36_19]OGU54777.1 MAG: hypothetical protein A2006_09380 [Ignavibacteria bacterium GWC2_35_8]OGU62510.1 MAG: hypothetical protein A2X60_17970 [Ignavibacteria bacterium GWF2_35_20]OGU81744.1 MAG: hypothetical protein A2254_11390 [Ignavibacteria bacterium RIFOXYA2_FULL_35_9]OGU82781.1 MAG: hypothetical protein A2W11_00365 [Ignavibacteria bacterium RBG_16_35_7]OGU87568.1 MAG: hypothetical protein A3K31_03615 [Ignavibacteria bac